MGLVASVIPLVPAWGVDRSFDYLVPEELEGRVVPGCVVTVTFGHRNVRAVVRRVVPADPSPALTGEVPELEPIARLTIPAPLAAPPMDDVLEWMARRYATPRGAAYARIVPPRVRVKVSDPGPVASPEPRILPRYEGGPELLRAIEDGSGGVWVVRPTSAERIDLVSEIAGIAAAGGGCVIAVPEVRYGSSLLEGVASRLGDMRRVDSARPDNERSASWVAGALGHPLLGGGRAAVLTPSPKLAAIVLDEEHHRTFKEDRSPRYDARRVAVERARLQGAACVLVSPTPALDISADPGGKVRTVTPPRDAVLGERTTVELVAPPSDWFLSPQLHRQMTRVLGDGGRVGLLVPRAGFARAVWCASCRRSIRCERCEAGLTYDRDPARLRCPRCSYEAPLPEACPSCGAEELKLMGAGSQKVAAQLARSFPRAKVARVDPDSLAEGELPDPDAAIYVTTWIGTKEALRPEVQLVGVLDVDQLIHRPDYRAAETAYQALWEMATWAGPRTAGGRLVLQTSDPGHHSVQAIARMDHDFFAERELSLRRELGYPPFSQLVRVRATGDAREGWIGRVAHAAEQAGGRVLGPVTVRITADQRRAASGTTAVTEAREVLIKCPDAAPVAERLRDILASAPAAVRLRVDVDPH